MFPPPRLPDSLRVPPEAARGTVPSVHAKCRLAWGRGTSGGHTKGHCSLRLSCGSCRGPGCSAAEATGSPGEKVPARGESQNSFPRGKAQRFPEGQGHWSLLSVPALRKNVQLISPAACSPHAPNERNQFPKQKAPFWNPAEGATANPPESQAGCQVTGRGDGHPPSLAVSLPCYLFRGGKNTGR